MNAKWHWLALLLVGHCSSGLLADDTEVYLRRDFGDAGSSQPLVMFTVDWRSNLSSTVCQGTECDGLRPTYLPASGTVSFFQLLRAVLRKVLDDMAVELQNVKVGLMINHSDTTGGACGAGPVGQCSNGGYVLHGFDADKHHFHEALSHIPLPQGNAAHPFQGKELYFEFFRYLTGQGIYNGHKGWEDFGDKNKADNLNVDNPGTTTFYDPLVEWDTDIEDDHTRYISPLRGDCTRIFAINFMFAVSQQEDGSDAAIKAAKAAGGMNSLNLSGNNNNFATVIRFMRDADLADGTYGTAGDLDGVQNVTSYFFVDESQLTQANQKGYASAGGTNTALPLSSDPRVLIQQLTDIFKQILSVSTSFVSATVPSNLFNRVDTLEHVFFGLFQPEESVRWNGNLKRFRIDQDSATGNLKVVDQQGTEAISPTDGRIKNDVLSFWTTASGFDVLYADTSKGEVAGKDGRSVGRGGAGQQIPGFLSGSPGDANGTGTRQVFTEPDSYTNGTAAPLRALNADGTTAAAAWEWLKLSGALGTVTWTNAATYAAAASTDTNANGVRDDVDAINLLKFIRGLDIYNEYAGTETQAHPWAKPSGKPVRPWLFGDPIHAKPTPVNYGTAGGYTTTNQALYMLTAGNDGYLRLFRNKLSDGTDDGREMWAFIPRRLLGNVKKFADNPDAANPLYGLDGGIAVYTDDVDGNGTIGTGDKVYAYVGMRRGGKGYYALDITNPATPKMLWSIYKGDSSGDFDDLGLTFATPVLGRVNLGTFETADVKPVLIFAGGYDLNKDLRATDNPSNALLGTNDTEGNFIYVVDAANGSLVRKFTAGTDSIPSTVTAIDTDGNGWTDRLYVGDTGGVVWRGDLPAPIASQADPTSTWTLVPVLSVGRHAGEPDRRFFHSPDFVPAKDSVGPFDAVIIGSGNREAPRDTNVQNQFYVFKERPPNLTVGNPPTTAKLVTDLQDLTDTATVYSAASFPSGWRFDLGSSASGEKMLTSPLTYFGRVYFSTYLPNENVEDPALECAPTEGLSQSYVVNLSTGGGVFNFNTGNDTAGETSAEIVMERATITGGGLPSDPVFISYKGSTYITPGNIPQTEQFRLPVFSKPLWQIYWYKQE
ncbi:pilus assembly protein [Methylotetracoccus oryzae]|uniref:pilus assembly protein n=1 Tax=Methylotetracoccus oryzae TaxID=1919059 RepID=UPI001118FE12|nr:PilC/PilY family type IV pilus protein [Methylotetracoccus oryzae]